MFTTNIKSSGVIKVDEGDFQPLTIPQMFHDTVSNNRNNLCISWKSTNDANLYHNLSNIGPRKIYHMEWIDLVDSSTDENHQSF